MTLFLIEIQYEYNNTIEAASSQYSVALFSLFCLHINQRIKVPVRTQP
jgi:hypothetical protein